ncbi:MAG: uroporphyrinogen decarboxylase [Gammaproteobacteria bacterium]|nr:uroporphyrinogen decarboxylase [Gammaproteobacteria bacterium]
MSILNSSLMLALNKENLKTPPVWYMRQAGRYMKEYRDIRKKFKNFLDMCKNPDVCCELALQPINAFDLDAAILFSDILTIPDAFGLEVSFIENQGPVFNMPIDNPNQIKNLKRFDPQKLSYVYKAVKNIRNVLSPDIPLIGFSGSPWTLAAYSIEGRSSKDFKKTLAFLEAHEKESHMFLDILTNACFEYLKEQVKAGVNVIQIFDSWANLLNENMLHSYSHQYLKSLIGRLKEDLITSKIPIILFSRNPKCEIENLIETKADCISLYWNMNDFDLDIINGKVAIQGNLNPEVLLQSREIIKQETYKILDKFKDFNGYIFNLGHGITPNIDPNNIKYLTDIIREY